VASKLWEAARPKKSKRKIGEKVLEEGVSSLTLEYAPFDERFVTDQGMKCYP